MKTSTSEKEERLLKERKELQASILASHARQVTRPTEASVVARLIELLREKTSPEDVCFKSSEVIEAYKQDQLYVQSFTMMEPLVSTKLHNLGMILGDAKNTLSCFCIATENHDGIHYLWTHPDYRQLGLGRMFVQYFDVESVFEVPIESHGFWETCGVIVESLNT